MPYGRLGLIAAAALLGAASTANAQVTDSDIDARIRAGVRQFESGDLAAARASFEGVLADRPDHVVALYELAFTHFRQGERERGLEILDDAIARRLPVTAEFYSLSASTLDTLGRIDESVERFEQGVAAFPDNHNLWLNFGITQLVRQRQPEAARASFERAITLLPDHPSAHFYLGQIYAQEGKRAAAVLVLAKGIGFDNQQQRVAAAANIIKSLMTDSVQLLEDGTPVVYMPVDYIVPPMTIEKFTAAVPMHYSTALVIQRKAGGDLSYEPYAIALALLVTEFARADFGPDPHFVARVYQPFFGPMNEGGHGMAYTHLILASLNAQAATAWAEQPENVERIQAFRNWTRSRSQAQTTGSP